MEHLNYGLLFKKVHDSLEKKANSQLRPKGLTMMQVAVLQAINNSKDKQMTMKEIESHFQVSQPTIVGLIARLEKKGFVKPSDDSSDKRIKIVNITKAGENCCIEAEKNMKETETLITKNFTEDEKVLLHSLLCKVLHNIK